MTDFSPPHPDCKANHTKYQPSEAEWRCPKCNDDGEAFYIDRPAGASHHDCMALHVDDVVTCDGRKHNERQSWSGRVVATMLAKKANLVMCRHCKGDGFVSRKKSRGAA